MEPRVLSSFEHMTHTDERIKRSVHVQTVDFSLSVFFAYTDIWNGASLVMVHRVRFDALARPVPCFLPESSRGECSGVHGRESRAYRILSRHDILQGRACTFFPYEYD